MLHTEELIQKFAMLKRNCFASVFEKYFDYQQAGSGGESHAVINYREDESMWVEQFLFTFSFFISSFSCGNCIITIYSSTFTFSFLTWNCIVRLITADLWAHMHSPNVSFFLCSVFCQAYFPLERVLGGQEASLARSHITDSISLVRAMAPQKQSRLLLYDKN